MHDLAALLMFSSRLPGFACSLFPIARCAALRAGLTSGLPRAIARGARTPRSNASKSIE
jgi:hypothetical protein